jgi:elongator complex protein 2
MILGAAWKPLEQPNFVTAGRDKTVKIWQITNAEVQLKGTIAAAAAVTAVACSSQIINGRGFIAFGTETGDIGIGSTVTDTLDKVDVTMVSAGIS